MDAIDIRELRKQAGITQQELAEKSGIPRDRIARWEQRGGNVPKAIDRQKILDAFSTYSLEVPSKIDGTNVPNKTEKPDKMEQKTIHNLSESVRAMAEGNNKIADGVNKIAESVHLMAQTNTDITKELLRSQERSANAVLGMPLSVAERFASVLKLVARAGSRGWETEDEALAEINKVFYAYLKQGEEADIPTAPGK